ncbi:hypothetical protein HGRIS_010980 [Hohenbuehelia grisea]|uniref:Superoxide dismutase [Cu-Zn] n=1 Tax=Hohenbuehelia grisea TaxID=104357 RepID=A0ABR3IYQ0_9AGAR
MKFFTTIALLAAAATQCAAHPTIDEALDNLVKRGGASRDWLELATVDLSKTPQDANSPIVGKVTFLQFHPKAPVYVTGVIKGLDPNTKRGLHVHTTSNFTEGCMSTGTHFNPFNKKHGARKDVERHVGDLGNIVTDETGTARFFFKDRLLSLVGENKITSRSLVLHSGTDDLGRGGFEDSLTTGHAGGRFACGKIVPVE